jgi:outer membrane protein insertion porin family
MVRLALLALSLASQQLPATATQPPPDSPPVVRVIEIAFPRQGNLSAVEPATYLYYIQSRPSRPSVNEWVSYDRQTVLDDFQRLWATGFLDDLWIEVNDEPYANGVVGKHIIFNLEERPRVKLVDFEGSTILERTKIDDAFKEHDAVVRLDSFVDARTLKRCDGIIGDMLREKGYEYASVSHGVEEITPGSRVVRIVFHINAGPEVRIARVVFDGNRAFSDGALRGQMKSNKAPYWWAPAFLNRRGAYQASKYEDDVDLVIQYYRDRGYVSAHIGEPRLRKVRDSHNGRTRWVELRVPVVEGPRFRVGKVEVDGNKLVKSEALLGMFALKPGQYYREKAVRKGLEKAREAYGSIGYFEFTGYPDLKPREPVAPRRGVLDVTLRMQEGKQYFINRVAFNGNTTTHDTVIRRELALAEGGVFNTEALKYSVKRINQLGYFKPMEGDKNVKVEKTPGQDNKVDVTLNVEEQNRNQIQFGAGMSEYDGVFGSLSYTAANFLGRGESVSVAAQKGSRSNQYQVGFTEPYLFDRPISAGVELYSRKFDYWLTTKIVGYSEVREGSSFSVGRPVFKFSRASLNYTYEVVDTRISDELLGITKSASTSSAYGMPYFNSLLDKGRHIDSRITPTFLRNTVDNPMMPHSGMRLTGNVAFSSKWLRGSYDYTKAEGEAVLFLPTSRRTGFGLRAEAAWLRPFGTTTQLPYYLRYFLGGEYEIRGVEIRTVGPIDKNNRALGGNKFALFNAEYYLDIVPGMARALLFHDAGQAFAESSPIDLRQLRTSSGAELRVVVPMLNVPFRLIYAWNVYRDTFQPARTFKFAVGTTF